jgi:phage tail tape-measure protein
MENATRNEERPCAELSESAERAAREVEEALAELRAAEDRKALERAAVAVSRAAYRLLAAVVGCPPA